MARTLWFFCLTIVVGCSNTDDNTNLQLHNPRVGEIRFSDEPRHEEIRLWIEGLVVTSQRIETAQTQIDSARTVVAQQTLLVAAYLHKTLRDSSLSPNDRELYLQQVHALERLDQRLSPEPLIPTEPESAEEAETEILPRPQYADIEDR